jgi:membrane protein DedA with SNARE-associated domain
VPYRVFALSVAISTAIWAVVGLWLSAILGQSAAR